MRYIVIILMFIVCAFNESKAQTYIQYVDSAENYAKVGNWKDAERTTILALKLMPANKLNYMLWSNLGDIRSRMNDYPGALQAFEIALASAPQKKNIYNNRAYTYLQMGDTENARSDIESSLAIDSIQEWPLNMRGVLKFGEGKYEEAERDFESMRRHFPRSAAAYSGLGKIEAVKGNTNKSIEYLEKSLELSQDEDTWFYLILVNIEADKLPVAKEKLLVALKRYPRSGNLYLLRGILHKKNYENESAELDKKIALQYGADPHLVERFFPYFKK